MKKLITKPTGFRTSIALFAAMSIATVAVAEDTSVEPASNFAVGVQLAPLTFGFSVKYKSSDQWKWQAVISPDQPDSSFTLRALRTARQSDYWQSYLFGGVANGRSDFYNDSGRSTVLTGGLGVEWGWRARNSRLPPLFASVEFGLGYRETEREDDFNSDEDGLIFVLGAGLHYEF